ncbi:hypothetical protein C0995_014370 [Termitomyces sp. Mi166|nr:hypothetical protein C0995_014370 [Termitomyces sp. Mi166\
MCICKYKTNSHSIDVEGHITAIMHCPISVNAKHARQDIKRPGVQPKLEVLRMLYKGKKIIMGRDKLDCCQGHLAKEWIRNMVMIQVMSPAMTDLPKLKHAMSELLLHINGEYSSLNFISMHH